MRDFFFAFDDTLNELILPSSTSVPAYQTREKGKWKEEGRGGIVGLVWGGTMVEGEREGMNERMNEWNE